MNQFPYPYPLPIDFNYGLLEKIKELEERIKHLEELNQKKDNAYLTKIDTYNMI